MADTTSALNTPRKLSSHDMIHEFPVATGATIYAGQLVGVDASGNLINASGATGGTVVGRAKETVVSAAAGTYLKVEQGIFRYGNNASSVAAGDRFAKVYAADNQSVNKTNTNVLVGRVYDVDSSGVWVSINPLITP